MIVKLKHPYQQLLPIFACWLQIIMLMELLPEVVASATQKSCNGLGSKADARKATDKATRLNKTMLLVMMVDGCLRSSLENGYDRGRRNEYVFLNLNDEVHYLQFVF